MISKTNQQQETINEIHEIMCLLRGSNAKLDGDYRSTHLGTILEYLRNQQTEDKAITLQKLALMLGFAQRQIRENYIDGLIAFGIVSLSTDCKRWTWIGAKAIKNKYGELRKNTPQDNDYVIEELSKTSETPFMDSIGFTKENRKILGDVLKDKEKKD